MTNPLHEHKKEFKVEKFDSTASKRERNYSSNALNSQLINKTIAPKDKVDILYKNLTKATNLHRSKER